MSTTVETPGSEMVVYDRITDPAKFIESMGSDILKSEMFGCQTLAQGRIMALECAARKSPPLMLAERYHLIKGKLSMKADAMIGDFVTRAGGSHRIVERTAERAAVELTRDGQSQTFSLTWEEARAEPFVYHGREADVVEKLANGKVEKLKVKEKYATPRSRMQMLWARVVSDAVRAMAPEIVCGCYTPEEISDFDYVAAGRGGRGKAAAAQAEEPAGDGADSDSDDGQTIVVGAVEPAAGDGDGIQDQADAAAAQGQTTQLLATEGELDAAVHEQVVTQATAAQSPAATPPVVEKSAGVAPKPALALNTGVGTATERQVGLVKALFAELKVPRERLMAMLKRVNAATVASMSAAHCHALIEVLQREKAKRGN